MTRAWLLCLLPLTGVQAADAPRKPPPAKLESNRPQPDVKFLEYLGTMETDDENWTDIAATVLAERPASEAGKSAAQPDSAAKTVVTK